MLGAPHLRVVRSPNDIPMTMTGNVQLVPAVHPITNSGGSQTGRQGLGSFLEVHLLYQGQGLVRMGAHLPESVANTQSKRSLVLDRSVIDLRCHVPLRPNLLLASVERPPQEVRQGSRDVTIYISP